VTAFLWLLMSGSQMGVHCSLRAADERDKVREAELDALIDALANRVNTAPKIVDRFSRQGDNGIPLFNEEYDGNEQGRVKAALGKLNASDGNELWPRLVAHFDDKRYAFTYCDGQGMTHNASVGLMCQMIAYDDLELAFLQHSPGSPRAHLPAGRCRVRPPQWDDKDFRAWLDERQGKQLYELQIDLCEWAIATPAALKRLSANQRQEFIEKVKKQIETLKKTQRPVTDKTRFEDTWYSCFSPKRIKTLREEYEHPERRAKPDGPPMPPGGRKKKDDKEPGEVPKKQQ